MQVSDAPPCPKHRVLATVSGSCQIWSAKDNRDSLDKAVAYEYQVMGFYLSTTLACIASHGDCEL